MAVAGRATGVDAEVDGRRLRRDQNREAVLDALVALFHEGIYQPSTNDIAERAGISPRSVFRYFEDVDDLNRAYAGAVTALMCGHAYATSAKIARDVTGPFEAYPVNKEPFLAVMEKHLSANDFVAVMLSLPV